MTLVSHLLALGSLKNQLWGAHVYAFFAAPAAWGAVGALAALSALALAIRGRPGFAFPRLPAVPRWGRIPAVLLTISAGTAVFWIFRARHTLLGDGIPLTIELTRPASLHPREPLGFLLQRGLHELLAPLLRQGLGPIETAQAAVSLGSAVCGGLLVLVVVGLVREGVSGSPTAGSRTGLVLLGSGVLLAQGYMQLFFGYVENYTVYALVVAVYLWATLRYLNRRAPLLLPVLAFTAAFFLHLSGGVLFPSLLVPIAVGLRDRSRRAGAIRDLVMGGAAFLLLAGWLRAEGEHYNVFASFLTVARWALTRGEEHAPGYLLSPEHFRDFLNEQMLIGPFGLFIFLPLAAVVLLRRRRDAGTLFFLIAGVAYAAVSWLAGDSNLGYARNWDLLAPAGIVFTAGAVYFALRSPSIPAMPLVLVLIVSLYHTVPWVLLNTSTERSLARIESLPLGGGRTQALLATWYWNRGDLAEAKAWSLKGLEENPRSHVAYRNLALIDLARGDLDGAAAAYEEALALRPDQPEYRQRLVGVLLAQGDTLAARGDSEGAAARFRRATVVDPQSFPAHLKLGIALAGEERFDEALTSFERATALGSDAIAWFNLALTQARLGNREEARHSLAEARSRASDPALALRIEEALRALESP